MIVFVVVIVCGGALLSSGTDAGAVLLILAGSGLVGATVSRWVVDDVRLPAITELPVGGRF
ncbi:hypothetical protein ACQP2E_02435 [Actinoplanes sp. CA-015351]|uniref:hypothetical protein n=1 Tax=Actinoplanes sp. CA-015351 TaxID=3239897 RepID=UPI003D99BA91